MALLAALADLKAELGVTGSAQDARLTSLLRQASDTIETLCDRRFERRTLTETFAQPLWPRTSRILLLAAWPVIGDAVVTLAGTVLASTEYVLDADTGTLTRSSYGIGYGSPWGYDWGGTVTVAYTGGYILPGEDDYTLPGDIERCCLELAMRNYHQSGRDPTLRSETVPGVIEQSWSAIDSVPTVSGLPTDIALRLAAYARAVL